MSETTTETAAPMSCFEQLAIMQGLVARLFGSVISFNDPAHLDAPVVYVETPVGQLSFRPATADMRYFEGLPVMQQYPWDPHTSRETYERIVALTKLVPPGVLTYANPRLDTP
jgi:hypothetical protein